MGSHTRKQVPLHWQTADGCTLACHPNSQRWLSLAGFRKGSDYCFLWWVINWQSKHRWPTNTVMWSGQTFESFRTRHRLSICQCPPHSLLYCIEWHVTYMIYLVPESICAHVSRMDWWPLKSLPDSQFYRETVWCVSFLGSTEREKVSAES